MKVDGRTNCIRCGKEFTPKWNAKCCSEVCKNAAKIEYSKKYNAQYTPSYFKTRFEIFKRDNFTCHYCGRSPKKHGISIVTDHILPKTRGGTNEPDNLVTSCEECNLGKADVLLTERKLSKILSTIARNTPKKRKE